MLLTKSSEIELADVLGHQLFETFQGNNFAQSSVHRFSARLNAESFRGLVKQTFIEPD